MIGYIISISLIALSCYLLYREKIEGIAILLFAFSLGFLIFHTYCICTRSYDYEVFLTKRKAIEETLIEARKNKNNIELTSVIKEVIDFNKELNEIQYKNTTIFDVYIDDRFNNLKKLK